MFNPFNKNPTQQRSQQSRDGCKIKIKNTAKGREISFEGNCSKEQLAMARHGFLEDEKIRVEED